MAEELHFDAFDAPWFGSLAEARAEDDALADHWAELAQLERRAEEAPSLEKLEELQTEYQALKRDMFHTWCRWLASERLLRSWHREHRRPCSKGCGRAAVAGRRVCSACHMAGVRERRKERLRAKLARLDELDLLQAWRAELDSLMQVDLAPPPEQTLGNLYRQH